MSKKNKNPYRDGSAYNVIFGVWQKAQVTTKLALIEAGHSPHDINVVLSPRETAREGCSCLGNMSAKGEFYFAEKLKRKEIDGKKEDQRFRLRWRKEVLTPRKRTIKDKVVAKKTKATDKTAVKSKSKAKSKAEA